MPAEVSRRAFLRGTAAAAGLWLAPMPAFAQEATAHFRPVAPVNLPLDKPGVWTLNFAYTPVRLMTVDTPDRGKRTVWYMVYQVWNRTDQPRHFIPEFVLVTKDGSEVPVKYLDEAEPYLARKIKEVEDPTGALNIQTSIGITKNEIPVTKPDSVPRAVYGVAIWPDVSVKSAKANRFSVYVGGLSNANATAETDDGGQIVSKKVLQLDFVRPTDDAKHGINDIQPNDNNGLGAEKWIYRDVSKKPGK